MLITQLTVRVFVCTLFLMPVQILAQSAPAKLLVGDAKVQVVQNYSGPEPLSKPADIRIEDFRISPDLVTVDNSAASRLHARRLLREGQSPDTSPEAAAQHVQASFSDALVKDLQKTPIPAARITDADRASSKGALTVEGEFTSVDEGNKSKRIMIGFGRGASDVQAHVTVRLIADTKPILLSEFKLNSESSKKPGAAATMGFGAAGAAVAANSIGDGKATVEGDASRLAKAVAKQLENLMAAQNWIPAQPPAAK